MHGFADGNGSGAAAESQGGAWSLCYDSSTDCIEYPSADRGRCTDSSQNTFHGGCDAHTETVVLGHNSLGFTFGGFGQATWQVQHPDSYGYDYATEAEGDFLFRLGPGATPVAYRPTGKDTDYQRRGPGGWPLLGNGGRSVGASPSEGTAAADPRFGGHGALGDYACCLQGNTYAGEHNDACGGDGNWGATEMEVWYRVGS